MARPQPGTCERMVARMRTAKLTKDRDVWHDVQRCISDMKGEGSEHQNYHPTTARGTADEPY